MEDMEKKNYFIFPLRPLRGFDILSPVKERNRTMNYSQIPNKKIVIPRNLKGEKRMDFINSRIFTYSHTDIHGQIPDIHERNNDSGWKQIF